MKLKPKDKISKIVCQECQKDMGIMMTPHGDITHKICEECKKDFNNLWDINEDNNGRDKSVN